MKELERLKEIEKELKLLDGIGSLLYFDQRTIMPKKATEQRGEQYSYLAAKLHSLKTSKEVQIKKHLTNTKIN
jgi:Zn-dependent M32 family carboxypeptidase